MKVRRVLGVVSIIVGSVLTWRIGLVVNKTDVLSATDTSTSLDDRVTSLEKRVTILERQLKPATTSKTAAKKDAFLQLLNGLVASGNWAAVSGSEFWLDPTLYGNVVRISWEGWLQVQDANGVAYARLYDITNNRGVDNSNVSVNSRDKASFFSPALTIWRGQNQYRVELKSSTGYAVTISEARLRITTQ